MFDQPKKATLPVYGTPQDALTVDEVRSILDSVTEDHKKRVKSSVTEDFRVYPKSDSLYIVESVKDDAVKDVYTVNLTRGAACSCRDYIMRCAGNNMSCKHIWRVRVLVKLGALPSRKQDPFSWLTSELYKDIEWLESLDSDMKEFASEIEKIQSRLDIDGRQDADYKSHMIRRADVLTKATISDV